MAWTRVARTDEVTEDSPRRVVVGKHELALFLVAGRHYATSDVCTHEYASLSDGFLEGEYIECPMHQGRFHIPTGKATAPPVKDDIRTFPVRVEDGHILVDVPEG